MVEKDKWSKHAITACKQCHSSSSTRLENGVIWNEESLTKQKTIESK